jgi:hypothetical protein
MAVLTFPSIVPSSISFGIKYNTQINISSLSGAVQTIEVPGARWVCNMSFSDMEPEETRVLAAFLTELRGSSGRFLLYDFSHKNPRGSNLAAGTIAVEVDATIATPITSGTADSGGSTTTLVDAAGAFLTAGINTGDYIKNVTLGQLEKILSFTDTVVTIDGTWTTPVAGNSYEIYSNTGNTVTTSGWDTSETDVLLPGDYIELDGIELKVVTTAVSSDSNGEAIITFDPPIRIAPNNNSIIKRASCQTTMLLDSDESRWDTNNAGLLSTVNISCMEGY